MRCFIFYHFPRFQFIATDHHNYYHHLWEAVADLTWYSALTNQRLLLFGIFIP